MSACALALVSCGGGQSGPAAVDNGATPTGAGGTDGPAIALNPPDTVGESNRIGLTWQASSKLTSFTVHVKRAAELDFEAVDATIGSNAAQFARGASWRLDFPTASVRVRGCDASNQCVDSNERPLLDALVKGLARSTNSRQQFFAGPLRLSADGNTLAVWDSSAIGPPLPGPCEGLASKGAVLVFHRGADGRWTLEANLTRPNVLGLFGPGLALSGDGNTLIAPAYQDSGTVGGIDAPEIGAIFPPVQPRDDRGAIHVYTRDAQHQWSHQAFIKPAVTVANEGFGVRVEVTHDGNRVLVGARDRAYLFEREAGQWRQAKLFDSTPGSLIDMQLSPFLAAVSSNPAAGVMAISANGSTIALRTAASKDAEGRSLPPFGVRVYAQCDCGDSWRQAADLNSAKTDTLRDEFGKSLSLSHEGTTLAAGAPGDPGSDTDDPATSNLSSPGAGAVYIFATDGAAWQRRAFLKGRGARPCDRLGEDVVLSGNGKVLAARAVGMAADLIGVDPSADGLRRNQPAGAVTGMLQERCTNNRFAGGVFEAGAYVFEASPSGAWSHTAVALAPTREDLTITRLASVPSLALSADAQTMGILFGRFPKPSEPTHVSTIVVY